MDINQFITDNPFLSYVKGVKQCGISVSAYEKRYKRIHGCAITKYRRENASTQEQRMSLLEQECEKAGMSVEDVKHYWFKSEQFSIFAKNKVRTYEEIRDDLIAEMKKFAPHYPKIKRKITKDGHLLVVDPADVHFGKLSVMNETGEDYNLKVAEKRFDEAIDELIATVTPFNVSSIVLVLGNDILHVDTPFRMTTSGTPQDTDGMWHEAYTLAKNCYIRAIEKLVQIADVRLVFCPSNHDFMSGYMLADSVSSWFAHNEHVYGEVTPMHRQYLVYGENLLGFTHGDGAKMLDLPSLMAKEAKKYWGKTTFRYFYVHHGHHKDRKSATAGTRKQTQIEQDLIGITEIDTGLKQDPTNNVFIEMVRTPSAPDRWHFTKGYSNLQAIEVFLHHPSGGQIGRFTKNF